MEEVRQAGGGVSRHHSWRKCVQAGGGVSRHHSWRRCVQAGGGAVGTTHGEAALGQLTGCPNHATIHAPHHTKSHHPRTMLPPHLPACRWSRPCLWPAAPHTTPSRITHTPCCPLTCLPAAGAGPAYGPLPPHTALHKCAAWMQVEQSLNV